MTLQFIFFTITIQKRMKTIEQYLHEEQVEKRFDEMKMRQMEYIYRVW